MPRVPRDIRKTLATLGNGLEVRTSQIKDAGNGLFATKKFNKGELITGYSGEVIDYEEAERRVAANPDAFSHMRTVNRRFSLIDGYKVPKDGYYGGSFANDAQSTQFHNNAKFDVMFLNKIGEHFVVMRATENIEPDQEIFVDYGADYWKRVKALNLKKKATNTQVSQMISDLANRGVEKLTERLSKTMHPEKRKKKEIAKSPTSSNTISLSQTDDVVGDNGVEDRLLAPIRQVYAFIHAYNDHMKDHIRHYIDLNIPWIRVMKGISQRDRRAMYSMHLYVHELSERVISPIIDDLLGGRKIEKRQENNKEDDIEEQKTYTLVLRVPLPGQFQSVLPYGDEENDLDFYAIALSKECAWLMKKIFYLSVIVDNKYNMTDHLPLKVYELHDTYTDILKVTELLDNIVGVPQRSAYILGMDIELINTSRKEDAITLQTNILALAATVAKVIDIKRPQDRDFEDCWKQTFAELGSSYTEQFHPEFKLLSSANLILHYQINDKAWMDRVIKYLEFVVSTMDRCRGKRKYASESEERKHLQTINLLKHNVKGLDERGSHSWQLGDQVILFNLLKRAARELGAEATLLQDVSSSDRSYTSDKSAASDNNNNKSEGAQVPRHVNKNLLDELPQPTTTDLVEYNYEALRNDTVKLDRYRQAIDAVLKDKRTGAAMTIYVMGSGIESLVDILIDLLKEDVVKHRLIAVDKNAHMIKVLNAKKDENVGRVNLTVLNGDVRDTKTYGTPILPANIIVTDFIGVFGDNEMVREYMSKLPKELIVKQVTTWIPHSYELFVVPIATNEMHLALKEADDVSHFNKIWEVNKTLLQEELKQEVKGNLDRYFITVPKKIDSYTFGQNRLDTLWQNVLIYNMKTDRYNALSKAKVNILYGFVAYFEATLYKGRNAESNIKINSHTDGVSSWGYAYVPLKKIGSVRLQEEDSIHFEFSKHKKMKLERTYQGTRKQEISCFWYEWKVEIYSNKRLANMKLLIENSDPEEPYRLGPVLQQTGMSGSEDAPAFIKTPVHNLGGEYQVICTKVLSDLDNNNNNARNSDVEMYKGVPLIPSVARAAKDEDRYFEVKPSQIEGAGNGLYTIYPITMDDPHVMYYTGVTLSKEQLDSIYGDEVAPYALQLHADAYIDAMDANKSNLARYINDPLNSRFHANVKFVPVGAKNTVKIVATEYIPAGSELFVKYGREYWNIYRRTNKKKKQTETQLIPQMVNSTMEVNTKTIVDIQKIMNVPLELHSRPTVFETQNSPDTTSDRILTERREVMRAKRQKEPWAAIGLYEFIRLVFTGLLEPTTMTLVFGPNAMDNVQSGDRPWPYDLLEECQKAEQSRVHKEGLIIDPVNYERYLSALRLCELVLILCKNYAVSHSVQDAAVTAIKDTIDRIEQYFVEECQSQLEQIQKDILSEFTDEFTVELLSLFENALRLAARVLVEDSVPEKLKEYAKYRRLVPFDRGVDIVNIGSDDDATQTPPNEEVPRNNNSNNNNNSEIIDLTADTEDETIELPSTQDVEIPYATAQKKRHSPASEKSNRSVKVTVQLLSLEHSCECTESVLQLYLIGDRSTDSKNSVNVPIKSSAKIRGKRHADINVSVVLSSPNVLPRFSIGFRLYGLVSPTTDDGSPLSYKREVPLCDGFFPVHDGKEQLISIDMVDTAYPRKPDQVVASISFGIPEVVISASQSVTDKSEPTKDLSPVFEDLKQRFFTKVVNDDAELVCSLQNIRSIHIPYYPTTTHLLPASTFACELPALSDQIKLLRILKLCILVTLDYNNIPGEDVFLRLIERDSKASRLVYNVAMKVIVEACCMLANICDYRSDLRAKNAKSSCERFIDAFRTLMGDCDDLGKMCYVCALVLKKRGAESNDGLLKACSDMLSEYVVNLIGGAALSIKVPTNKEENDTEDCKDLETMICHIYASLIPKSALFVNLRIKDRSLIPNISSSNNRFVWIMEGTNWSHPFQPAACEMGETKEVNAIATADYVGQGSRDLLERYYPVLKTMSVQSQQIHNEEYGYESHQAECLSDFYRRPVTLWTSELLDMNIPVTDITICTPNTNTYGVDFKDFIYVDRLTAGESVLDLLPTFHYNKEELNVCLEVLKDQPPILIAESDTSLDKHLRTENKLEELKRKYPHKTPLQLSSDANLRFDIYYGIPRYTSYRLNHPSRITSDLVTAIDSLLSNKTCNYHALDYTYFIPFLDNPNYCYIEIKLFHSNKTKNDIELLIRNLQQQ
jgi:hypothetical protein